MFLNSLVGGLIGSILTIIATKIFDMIKMNFAHKNTLKKIFFEKKINSAETAVAQLSSISSSIHGLSALFEIAATKEETDFTESQIFNSIFQSISNQISELDKATSNMANSIFLYIDIDDKSTEKMKELIDTFAKLESIKNIIQSSRVTFEQDYRGTRFESEGRKKLNEFYNEYRKTLKEIAIIFDDIQDQSSQIVKKIRNEYKDYM